MQIIKFVSNDQLKDDTLNVAHDLKNVCPNAFPFLRLSGQSFFLLRWRLQKFGCYVSWLFVVGWFSKMLMLVGFLERKALADPIPFGTINLSSFVWTTVCQCFYHLFVGAYSLDFVLVILAYLLLCKKSLRIT